MVSFIPTGGYVFNQLSRRQPLLRCNALQSRRLLDKHEVGRIEDRGVALLENPPFAGIGSRLENGPEATTAIGL